MRFRYALALAGFITLSSAQAETNAFLQALSFALTGSDGSAIRIINRKECIFGMGKDVVHLNNVQIDRIKIQTWIERILGQEIRYVTVELHGSNTVYEEFRKGLAHTPGNEAIVKALEKSDPTASHLFESGFTKSTDHRFRLATDDAQRVARAWRYVYANGCIG